MLSLSTPSLQNEEEHRLPFLPLLILIWIKFMFSMFGSVVQFLNRTKKKHNHLVPFLSEPKTGMELLHAAPPSFRTEHIL
jgi:hypothetical protein